MSETERSHAVPLHQPTEAGYPRSGAFRGRVVAPPLPPLIERRPPVGIAAMCVRGRLSNAVIPQEQSTTTPPSLDATPISTSCYCASTPKPPAAAADPAPHGPQPGTLPHPPTGKRNTERWQPVSPSLMNALFQHASERGTTGSAQPLRSAHRPRSLRAATKPCSTASADTSRKSKPWDSASTGSAAPPK